ncbi:uncharacterized protein MONOS_4081 [Monocercomonoides exilis]|uniref:uncharacterized protein n=1 Tax=Monocercomonoides exilis TaxID=2049356 RepID=UPI00355A51CC|nr:hypothetical protein MONOS_4081 [Monocercomonoides exilis]|eukprot:MONOS_4081.1-p1 / transcript=MONOS_4081.1 / gene=MONOS_4081 / organism=Monocercomonoides_exilis_PA203 / gene_product=unspecified product / transcript_product=unspecified product / location=Mono_scaffold00104:18225-18443(+) / protein_length=73 / sequence_SO=supercontig / SO=protein_coding / is_pseudo=false
MGDRERGGDWGVSGREGIWRNGEEGEGEECWLKDLEREVGEGKGGMGREEKWVVFVIVVGVDLAGGGADGGG